MRDVEMDQRESKHSATQEGDGGVAQPATDRRTQEGGAA
jgi:hypothetical protein